jgi:site-specific DNA-methyltransferase (adenine-specific)
MISMISRRKRRALGRHRLLCGDSTDPDNLQRLMDGMLADLLLTDLPYNVDYTGKTKDALKIKNDVMAEDKFRSFLRAAFFCADSVMKPGAVFYIWHADSEGYNFRGACHDISWLVRQCLIWRKNSMVLGRQDYRWAHEPCIYGWKAHPTCGYPTVSRLPCWNSTAPRAARSTRR